MPFGHFNRDWRTRFWHSKWNSSTGRSTAAFSTAMSFSSKESQARPCPFNRDCELRNLTWSDQNPLNRAESHLELPIDSKLGKSVDLVDYATPEAAQVLPVNLEVLLREDLQTMLIKVAKQVDYPKELVSTVLGFGKIYDEVLEEAKAWGADLIVVASHRPAISTYLLGSDAGNIVRHASCSVLVTRR